MRKQTGFRVMETLIAVIILTAVAATYASLLLVQNKQDAKVDYREIESKELSQLYYGIKAYWTKNPTAVTATTQQIGINTLIADGELPTGFATRGGVGGQTPWRQAYTIYARNDPDDGTPRAVIYEGSPAAALPSLARAGVSNTDVSIAALKADIATKVTSTYKIPAATIAAGSLSAVGTLNSFTKDMTGLMPAGAVQSSAAVLAGYPDLEPPDPNATPGSQWGNCTVASPSWNSSSQPGWAVPAACPSGTQNLVHVTTPSGVFEGFPFCRMDHQYGEPNYVIYPTDIGDITLGQVDNATPVQLIAGYTQVCAGPPGGQTCRYSTNYVLYQNIASNETVMMNGAEVSSTPTCDTIRNIQGTQLANGSCDIGPDGLGRTPTAPSQGCARQGRTYSKPVVGYFDPYANGGAGGNAGGLGQNARELLCCQQLHP